LSTYRPATATAYRRIPFRCSSRASTAEGKDRLVSELRDVFVDIPSSAVREDLIALVATHLALRPSLVSLRMPTPGATSDDRPTSLTTDAQPSAAKGRPGHSLLVRCVTDPDAATALPFGSALAKLFPDALTRRAAEHIRIHATNPTADLPDDDHELISFITSLLTAPTGANIDV
jgi:hypothetical protein